MLLAVLLGLLAALFTVLAQAPLADAVGLLPGALLVHTGAGGMLAVLDAVAGGDLRVAAGVVGGLAAVHPGAAGFLVGAKGCPLRVASGALGVHPGAFRMCTRLVLMLADTHLRPGADVVAAGVLTGPLTRMLRVLPGARGVRMGSLTRMLRVLTSAAAMLTRVLAGALGVRPGSVTRVLRVLTGVLCPLTGVFGVLTGFGAGAVFRTGGGRGDLRGQRRGRGGQRQGNHPVRFHGMDLRSGKESAGRPATTARARRPVPISTVQRGNRRCLRCRRLLMDSP